MTITRPGGYEGRKEKTMYDYIKAIKNDILNYIRENIDNLPTDRYSLEVALSDISEEFTGKRQGTYTSSARAKEYVTTGGLDHLKHAMAEKYIDACWLAEAFVTENWCAIDSEIREYLFYQAQTEALDEAEKE